MAHLAVYSAFEKAGAARVIVLAVSQLAGVTWGAISLEIAGFRHPVKSGDVCPLAARRVDTLPVINPLVCDDVVLNRENLYASIRKPSTVSLLPFGADRVVHRITMPHSIITADLKGMPVVLHLH